MSNLTNKTESFGSARSRYALKYWGYTRTQSAGKMPEFTSDVGMFNEMTNQIKKNRYISSWRSIETIS